MASSSVASLGLEPQAGRFHFRMAVVFAAVAFGGFVPTYWAPLTSGTLRGPPIMHIHGAVLFAWTLFYVAQTAWIRHGRIAVHRSMGMLGIALFTLLVCSIILLQIAVIRIDTAQGFGEARLRFAAVPLLALPVMIATFAVAVAQVHRPDVHKRLMYSLMAGLVVPAIARVFLTVLAPPGVLGGAPPPPFVAVPPTVVGVAFIGAAMLRDWRLERRVHPAYLVPAAAFLLAAIAAVFVARTDLWLGIAGGLHALAG